MPRCCLRCRRKPRWSPTATRFVVASATRRGQCKHRDEQRQNAQQTTLSGIQLLSSSVLMDPTGSAHACAGLGAGEAGSIQTSRPTFNFVTSDYTRPRPKWRNWQTRRTQNPVPSGEWGFDSPLRHRGGDLDGGRSQSLGGRRGGAVCHNLVTVALREIFGGCRESPA